MALGIVDLLATAVNPLARTYPWGALSALPQKGASSGLLQTRKPPTDFTGTLENVVDIVDMPRNPISFAGEPVQPQLPVGQIRQTPQPVRPMSRQELMEMLFSNYQNRSMEGFNPKSRGFNSINTRFRQ